MNKFTFLFTAIFLFSAKSFAFGELGHRLVALLAQERLTPRAASQIQKIFTVSTKKNGDSPLEMETYDKANLLPEISTWADKVRIYKKGTAAWHYVKMELDEPAYNSATVDTPNIVTALELQVKILRNKKAPHQARQEALKWVVHLIGDLHQPLHMGENHDRGGNDQKVKINRRTYKLHEVWDRVLLEKINLDEVELHLKLSQELHQDPEFVTRNSQGTIRDWANETHLKARDCYILRWNRAHTKAEKIPKGIKVSLEKEYTDPAMIVVQEQIKLGGIRLATLLNSIFSIP